MNNRFIASHGIGEIFVEPLEMAWSMLDSSLFNKKSYPYFNSCWILLVYKYKYNRELMRENIWNRTLILDLNNII